MSAATAPGSAAAIAAECEEALAPSTSGCPQCPCIWGDAYGKHCRSATNILALAQHQLQGVLQVGACLGVCVWRVTSSVKQHKYTPWVRSRGVGQDHCTVVGVPASSLTPVLALKRRGTGSAALLVPQGLAYQRDQACGGFHIERGLACASRGTLRHSDSNCNLKNTVHCLSWGAAGCPPMGTSCS